MTVQELIDQLSYLPQGAPVYLSADAEGNGFNRLEELEMLYVRKEDVYHGHVDDVVFEEALDDDDTDFETVAVLWPV